jgi:hypothetical protein
MRKVPNLGKCKHCNATVWFIPVFDIHGQYLLYWKVVSSNNVKHECANIRNAKM